MGADEQPVRETEDGRPKIVEAVALHRQYSREIAAGLRSHYHDCHISHWISGAMPSWEFITLIEGMPGDSWLKTTAHIDAHEATGDEQVQAFTEAREATKRLLRGEVKTEGAVIEMTNGNGKARRTSGATAAQQKT